MYTAMAYCFCNEFVTKQNQRQTFYYGEYRHYQNLLLHTGNYIFQFNAMNILSVALHYIFFYSTNVQTCETFGFYYVHFFRIVFG